MFHFAKAMFSFALEAVMHLHFKYIDWAIAPIVTLTSFTLFAMYADQADQ